MARKRNNSKPFVSKADDKELREYQHLASKYPPLSHEKLVLLSHRFIAGRNAQVELDESEFIEKVIGDDWSEDNLRESETAVKRAFDTYIAVMEQKITASSLITENLGVDDGFASIYEHRNDNILEGLDWLEPVSACEILGCDPDISYSDFVQLGGDITDAIFDYVNALLPAETPKDVLDRWKADRERIAQRYMATVATMLIDDAGKHRRRSQARQAEPALEQIVNHNLQLAMSRVGKFMTNNSRAQKIGVSELIAAANVGLVLGARQFDPTQKKRFSTYAAFHIDGQLHEIINTEDGNCGIKGASLHEQKQIYTIISVRRTFKKKYGRDATMSELQSITNIAASIIDKRLRVPAVKTQNIYAPVSQGNKKDDEGSVLLVDTLVAEQDVEGTVDDGIYNDMLSILKHEIATLDDLQQTVVKLKMGISDDENVPALSTLSTSKIASTLGLTPKRVDEVYLEAMEKLRGKMELRGYTKDMLK